MIVRTIVLVWKVVGQTLARGWRTFGIEPHLYPFGITPAFACPRIPKSCPTTHTMPPPRPNSPTLSGRWQGTHGARLRRQRAILNQCRDWGWRELSPIMCDWGCANRYYVYSSCPPSITCGMAATLEPKWGLPRNCVYKSRHEYRVYRSYARVGYQS